MASDLPFKALNLFHRSVLALSLGHLGWKGGGMPVLELTTTGRKTGMRRTNILTSPVQLGDRIVVVASRGGDDRHPDWFVNLRADPHVDVVYQGRPKVAMIARVATPAERAELWPQIVAAYKAYGDYQRKTTRQIPVVLLEPA